MCSVVLRPSWLPERVGLVSLAAGTAMAEAASEASGLDVRCKWPNDLLVGTDKVGGILGEAAASAGGVDHVIVGVGVNLDVPEDVRGAGAIGPVDGETMLGEFLRRLRVSIEGDAAAVVDRWRAVSATLGRRVRATTVSGGVAFGIATDIDRTGALLLETDTGRVRVAFGEIEHLEMPRDEARRGSASGLRGRGPSR
jgi:BirA family biotin operon repressor/biotin-[acetyl-CoA-carboxylase] ligase